MKSTQLKEGNMTGWGKRLETNQWRKWKRWIQEGKRSKDFLLLSKYISCERRGISLGEKEWFRVLRLWQVYQVAQVVTGKTGISFPKRLVYT